jgi:2-dehydro-3-deoxygluconokinase
MSRIVTFGEIMVRVATPSFLRLQQALPGKVDITFAGAEASIAAGFCFLGGEAAFVTALPNHAVADACIADLRSMGVDTSQIIRTSQGRLGIYYYERGVNQRASQVIYDRDGSSIAIMPTNEYDWEKILSGAEWLVISGITPAISKNAAIVTRDVMQAANDLGVKVACDMNYRSKLWQWAPPLSARELATSTMRELLPMVDLFIGGREDAAEVLGVGSSSSEPQELVRISREICSVFRRLKYVAMTRRIGSSANVNSFGGMLYDSQSEQAFFAPRQNHESALYQIGDIVDRLGAGDAFTAGLLFSLTRAETMDLQQVVEFATAAGCLAHSIEGDYNFVSRSEIEAIVAGDQGGRVSR